MVLVLPRWMDWYTRQFNPVSGFVFGFVLFLFVWFLRGRQDPFYHFIYFSLGGAFFFMVTNDAIFDAILFGKLKFSE